jgi:hypothetical protein
MKAWKIVFQLIPLATCVPGLLSAVELQPGTLKAWDDYIRNADSLIQLRLAGQRPFLWSDELSNRNLPLRRGEILVAPVVGRGSQSVANGLIHDWIGAVFIPNATIASLLTVIHDYDRYKDFYQPVVAESQTLACTESDQRFSMVWRRRVLLINAAMESQYQSHDFVVDGRRGYSIVSTTQVREIEDAGRSSEHLLPPGQGSGYIWRLHSIARYEERDGGVYLELQAIALTRDIPSSLKWLVSPVVNHLSVNSLTTSLQQTRAAVNTLPQRPERFVSCTMGRRTSASAGKPAGTN